MNNPMAYAAVADDGSEAVYVASLKEQAEAACRENGWTLVPLHAASPLSDEERHALKVAWMMACRGGPLWDSANTLRKMLERLGGGE